MARISNEKFGIISSKGEIHVLKKMGITEKIIYTMANGNNMLRRMTAGDALCVASVSSFASSVYDLYSKLLFLSNNGIEFRSGNEKYLSFSPIAPLSMVTRDTLENFARREAEFMKYIQVGNISTTAKTQLMNRVRRESLTSITLVFRNEGIKKKGN